MWKYKLIFLACILGPYWGVRAVQDGAAGSNQGEHGEPKFYQEIECSKAGGICIARESCPSDKVSEEGQCPKQSNLKAVCCMSLSMTETRCQQLGGHCRDACPEDFIIARANDCSEGHKCCPLV